MPKITNSPDGPTYAEDPPDSDVVWHDPPDEDATSDDDARDEGVVMSRSEPAGPVDRPSPHASKAAWVDYACARGWDRDDAEKLSRDELASPRLAPWPDAGRSGVNESDDDESAVWVGDDETLTKVEPGSSAGRESAGPMPERGAPRMEWIKYAKARGWSDADVNGMTRQELVTAFARPETR